MDGNYFHWQSRGYFDSEGMTLCGFMEPGDHIKATLIVKSPGGKFEQGVVLTDQDLASLLVVLRDLITARDAATRQALEGRAALLASMEAMSEVES